MSPRLPRPGTTYLATATPLLLQVAFEGLEAHRLHETGHGRLVLLVVTTACLGALAVARAGALLAAMALLSTGALGVVLGATSLLEAAPRGVALAPALATATLAGGLLGSGCAVVRSARPVGGRDAHRRAHRVRHLLVVVAWALLVVLPVGTAVVQLNLPRTTGAAPPPGFVPVELVTGDGLALRAWQHPSSNGAGVVVVASARGDHATVREHAGLLAEAGYGVLVYDARGSGRSEGSGNGWGWGWAGDVEAAVSRLLDSPDVVGPTVGILGLSTGADVALEVAATDPRVGVVVADGATAGSFDDRPPGVVDAVSMWPMFAAADLLSDEAPGPRLSECIQQIAPRPVLLIAADGMPVEAELNQRYARAGGPHVTLWELEDTEHTKGITAHPDTYRARVLSTLGSQLLP